MEPFKPQWLYKLPSKVTKRGSIHGRGMYLCSCGKLFPANTSDITTGNTKSCGCYFKKRLLERLTLHGECKTTEYRIWAAMIRRCRDKAQKNYKFYGARGIRVCSRWKKSGGEGYINFLSDMGRRPGQKYSIDRINVNGDYEPDNCRWATHKEQMNNTRRVCHGA